MKCLFPIWLTNSPSEQARTGNLGKYVPCGKCEACVRQKQEDWFVRLKFEEKSSDFVWFVTLTYDDEHIPVRQENGSIFNDVNKKDIQDYHKRLRSKMSEKSVDFKFYLCAEYGGQLQRPHYHAIYFNINPVDLHFIQEAWKNGFVMIEEVNDARLRYVTGYVIEKLFVPEGRLPVFNLISKGIGKKYINVMKDWHNDDTSRFYAPLPGGVKAVLPRYYKEKIYSDSVRRAHSRRCEEEASDSVYQNQMELGFEEYERLSKSVRSDFVRKMRNHRKIKKRNF